MISQIIPLNHSRLKSYLLTNCQVRKHGIVLVVGIVFESERFRSGSNNHHILCIGPGYGHSYILWASLKVFINYYG